MISPIMITKKCCAESISRCTTLLKKSPADAVLILSLVIFGSLLASTVLNLGHVEIRLKVMFALPRPLQAELVRIHDVDSLLNALKKPLAMLVHRYWIIRPGELTHALQTLITVLQKALPHAVKFFSDRDIVRVFFFAIKNQDEFNDNTCRFLKVIPLN